MREEVLNASKSIDAATLADIKAAMLKNFETASKENGHWVNVLSMYVGRGIDTHTDYVKVVNSLTPEKVSAFVNTILGAGNNIEVVMLPEE